MRGTKAKELRRMAYGDMSLKSARQYQHTDAGMVRNNPYSPRSIYQRLKKAQ